MPKTLSCNRPAEISQVVDSIWSPSVLKRVEDSLRAVTNAPYAIASKVGAVMGGEAPVREATAEMPLAVEKLSADVLSDLFENRRPAIHVPGFCSREVCDKMSDYMVHECELKKWGEESEGAYTTDMFYGVGLPENAMRWSREACRKYFEQVLPIIKKLREVAGGDLVPTDQLRLELDELWPNGAQIETVQGQKRMIGLGRVMRPDGLMEGVKTEGIIHIDTTPMTSPTKGQFSANIYLKVPETGGELCVWNVLPTMATLLRSPKYFSLLEAVFNNDGNEIERQRELRALLPPPMTIKPRQGDLVLVDTARPHAVRGFTEGLRVTFQTFVGYTAGKPLKLYC